MIILLDNGHGYDTKGKCSPDGRLKEYAWARDVAKRIQALLKADGKDARLVITEQNDISLKERVRRVNAICKTAGAKNCLLVSVHINAAGADGKWHTAKGFSVFVSKNASSNSKKCAALFTDEATRLNLLGNRSVPSGKYWTWSWTKSDIYILANTNCPAVLTENLFQDNKEDVEYLLSEQGKNEIAKLHFDAIKRYIANDVWERSLSSH